MACEIAMDIIPSYITFFYNLLIGVTLTNYAGDCIGLLASLEAAMCALYYWHIFQVVYCAIIILNKLIKNFSRQNPILQRSKQPPMWAAESLNRGIIQLALFPPKQTKEAPPNKIM